MPHYQHQLSLQAGAMRTGSPSRETKQPSDSVAPASFEIVTPVKQKKKQNQPKTHLPSNRVHLKKRAIEAVRLMSDGLSTRETGIRLGYSPTYASQAVKNLVDSPTNRASFAQILDAAGVTDDALAEKLKCLMDSKKTIITKHKQLEVPDNTTQLGALTLGTKLKGHLIERSLSVNVEAGFVDLDRYGNGNQGSNRVAEAETIPCKPLK